MIITYLLPLDLVGSTMTVSWERVFDVRDERENCECGCVVCMLCYVCPFQRKREKGRGESINKSKGKREGKKGKRIGRNERE